MGFPGFRIYNGLSIISPKSITESPVRDHCPIFKPSVLAVGVHSSYFLPSSFSSSSSMADPALHPETLIHETIILKEIAVDYSPEVCTHCPESNEIAVVFDKRGGSRWRSKTRFQFGTFGARIQCPKGNTSGLNFNIYLSSVEGDKSQDEIDFEFLGKDKTIIQTNMYTTGTGNREKIHQLGFDCSDGFHDYEMKWSRNVIEWSIDGKSVRRDERKQGEAFPEKPMFLYASVWDASYIDESRWAGTYVGCDAPYVCLYRDVRVPIATAVVNNED